MRQLLSLRSGRIQSSSKGRITHSSPGMLQNFKWFMVMIGLSIILALIGSVDVGHAFFKERQVKTSSSKASLQKKSSSFQIERHPGSTTTATKSPMNAPTPTTIPTVTSTMPPASPAVHSIHPTVVPVPSDTKTLVRDTFMRVNSVSWGSTPDGFTWQGDTNARNVFSVNMGEGLVANTGGYYSAVIGPNVSQSMLLVSGKIANKGKMDDGAQTSIGALLRWQDKDNWYKAYIDGNVLGIKRVKNGKTAVLATLPFVAQPAVSYTIRFRAENSTLSTSVWETQATEPQNWMLTVHDSALSSGLGGVRLGIGKNAPVSITSFTELQL